MSAMSVTETRVKRLMDERASITTLHEDMMKSAENRDDPALSDIEESTLVGYRTRATEIDAEIVELHETMEAEQKSAQVSELVRKHLAGKSPGVDADETGVRYRTFAAYARDEIVTKHGETFRQIADMAGGDDVVKAARERLLLRAPAHTLSSDVEGLQPEQHIAQILDVIDNGRPLVSSAQRTVLTRGRIQYPRITSKPVVAVQGTEKTEGGNTKLSVEMVDATASTYIGGGNLSWQTIEWSTPDALDLWFRIVAADYALKTEQDAGEVIQTAAAANLIADQLAGTSADTFADWILAVTEGAGEVYANSGAMADTVYLAPDMFYLAAALTSAAGAMLINAGNLNVGAQTGSLAGMRLVVSRGLDAGVAIVGDSQAFLVAENPGAPVQLRAVEPAIGGLEVGVIGAFEAIAFDDDRFALIGTAS